MKWKYNYLPSVPTSRDTAINNTFLQSKFWTNATVQPKPSEPNNGSSPENAKGRSSLAYCVGWQPVPTQKHFPCLRFTFRCDFMCVINLICSCKATSGRPAYSPALCQIKTTLVKLLVYFWCQVKIWEGQAKDSMTITVLSFENHAF